MDDDGCDEVEEGRDEAKGEDIGDVRQELADNDKYILVQPLHQHAARIISIRINVQPIIRSVLALCLANGLRLFDGYMRVQIKGDSGH